MVSAVKIEPSSFVGRKSVCVPIVVRASEFELVSADS